MKQVLTWLAGVGVLVGAAPAPAQPGARPVARPVGTPAPQAVAQTTPQACDSLGAARVLAHPFTAARHQVLAPRDSSLGRPRLTTRRVRLADGSIHVSKYTTSGVHVTKGGPPVATTQPVACPAIAETPAPASGTSVGDVTPAPVTAPGEVVPPLVPTVGSRIGLPLLGGLLLGGTAFAVGSHHPGTPAAVATADSLPTTPGSGGGTGGGGTGGGGTGGGGTGGGGTSGGGTGGGGTGGGGTGGGGGGGGGGGTGGGPTGAPGTVVPEPTTIALTAVGVLMLTGYTRRRRR